MLQHARYTNLYLDEYERIVDVASGEQWAGREEQSMTTATFQINNTYSPELARHAINNTVCSGAMNHVTMHQMDFVCTEDYAAIVKENEALKAEVEQLKERLAALE